MYSVRNLEYLRSAKPTDAGYAVKLAEALRDIVKCGETVEGQTNANASGNPAPPPPLQAVTVTPTSVGHHVSINHGSEFYRGAYYHVESSASPAFTNPFPVYSGPAREIDLATGNQSLYFQAFASYQTSDNTPPVFHGGTIPKAVTGGVNVPLGTSQGSGTGQPGQGLQGFGSAAFRSTTGKPPTRGAV